MKVKVILYNNNGMIDSFNTSSKNIAKTAYRFMNRNFPKTENFGYTLTNA